MKKIILYTYALVLCLTSNFCAAEEITSIEAIVGSEPITNIDVAKIKSCMLIQGRIDESSLNQPNSNDMILNYVVDRKLMLSYVARFGLRVPDNLDLVKSFTSSREAKLSKDQLVSTLKQYKLTLDEFESFLKEDFLVTQVQQKYLASETNISSKDVHNFMTAYYKENTKYHILDIYLPKGSDKVTSHSFSERVNDAISRYKDGREQLAPMTITDLGVKSIDQMPSLYKNVVSNIKVDTPSYMVIAPNGYHSLLMLEKQKPKEMSADYAKYILTARQGGNLIPKWIKSLRDSTYIEIR
ncbi:MAG: SurA N-terminal domain-containing protein [Pseudomonadota bacterium]|nr:SurA N-terminal domain-containing protein [Pseudomonadota bacterium]